MTWHEDGAFSFPLDAADKKSEIPPPAPTHGFPGVIVIETLIFVSCKESYSPSSSLALFRLPMGLLMAQRLLRKEGGRGTTAAAKTYSHWLRKGGEEGGEGRKRGLD